jgi:phosphate starvation-inducible PhoH-like protein
LRNMRSIVLPEKGLKELYGVRDRNLKLLEDGLAVNIAARGSTLMLEGDEDKVSLAERIIKEFVSLIEGGYSVKDGDFKVAIKLILENPSLPLTEFFLSSRIHPSTKKEVSPKSVNQKDYIEAIKRHDLVFSIGPAGTGKTYLAMAMALSALESKLVSRIILTRPALEAGEKLGFLPGDLLEKVNPYLRPLYDALYDLTHIDKAHRLLERGYIEIAPIAFMRGRTLSDSFVILDEAQNTTIEQMKMFLTRTGLNSKVVVTGDITQIDLPQGTSSGLKEAVNILSGIKGIAFIFFDKTDVVRHPLVQEIIDAFERHEGSMGKREEKK